MRPLILLTFLLTGSWSFANCVGSDISCDAVTPGHLRNFDLTLCNNGAGAEVWYSPGLDTTSIPDAKSDRISRFFNSNGHLGLTVRNTKNGALKLRLDLTKTSNNGFVGKLDANLPDERVHQANVTCEPYLD